MKKEYLPFVEELIELAIREDIGDGDHSSLSSVPANQRGRMKLLVKESGIIAGIEIAKMVFNRLDSTVTFEQLIEDGQVVKYGDIAFYVEGDMIILLQSERIILNIMQRMSGVATQTSIYVKELEGLKTKVLDTRKTTPGMRALDKIAVKIGGGVNHRIGLFDMIMLKDNHIDFAGGIPMAVNGAREYLKKHDKDLKIEVETRSLEDIKQCLELGVDRIMLDNFSIEMTKAAVELINGACEVESSGGITLDTIKDYAMCGVDYVSVGALTHQIHSIDMSLKSV